MAANLNQKIKSISQLYDAIPEHQHIMVDILRAIVAEQLPACCKEKISYQVPFFMGKMQFVE